jgi:hypothetical protein
MMKTTVVYYLKWDINKYDSIKYAQELSADFPYYLSAWLPVCLSVYVSVCLSVCLSDYIEINVHACLRVRVSV